MFNIIGDLVGSVVGTVGDVVKKDQAIKEIKEKGKLDIAQAKVNLDVAKLNAQIKQQQTQAANDMTYDMQVLKNRRESFIDEFIILGFFVINLSCSNAIFFTALSYPSAYLFTEALIGPVFAVEVK